jgi:hypothetical protein
MDAAEVRADEAHGAHLAPAAEPTDALSRREREILAFERQWWKYAGAKEQAIRELFDMSATRYYQVLNGLIDKQGALEADPMLIKRLRRLRSSRQRARAARRLGVEPHPMPFPGSRS